ncbi:MAG TPA: hypothetical protein VII37_00165, partial [Candidatus Acidoferrum sp.]
DVCVEVRIATQRPPAETLNVCSGDSRDKPVANERYLGLENPNSLALSVHLIVVSVCTIRHIHRVLDVRPLAILHNAVVPKFSEIGAARIRGG